MEGQAGRLAWPRMSAGDGGTESQLGARPCVGCCWLLTSLHCGQRTAPLSRGSSPRLPFACEEFPKTTPNASPAVSKGQDQGASAPRHQHCVRGPVSPGIVTRQLTVEGTGGKVVETRQLAANEEN